MPLGKGWNWLYIKQKIDFRKYGDLTKRNLFA
jgi:hypothetical protein